MLRDAPVTIRKRSALPGRLGVGVDAVALDRILHHLRLDRALVGERLQGGHRHVMTVDLEELPELLPVVAAPEAVGTENGVAARYEVTDLVGERAHVVG